MDRYEREELAELILRVIATTREATTALFSMPADMAAWSRTADAESTARRELWQALYRLEMADGPKGIADQRSLDRRLPKPR